MFLKTVSRTIAASVYSSPVTSSFVRMNRGFFSSPVLNAQFYLSPQMAKALYMKVDANGQGDKIASLSNAQHPDKLKQTLNLLGVNIWNAKFCGWNGYYLDIDKDNINKIHKIVNSVNEKGPKVGEFGC
ncbi:MAG: hypothetical protein WC627_08370 [Legionella sp.]|jgi:hypothetical protein